MENIFQNMDVIYYSFQYTDFPCCCSTKWSHKSYFIAAAPNKIQISQKSFSVLSFNTFFLWKTRLSTPLDNKSICCVPWCEYLKILGMFTIWHVAITKCVDNFYYLLFYSTFVMKKTLSFRCLSVFFPVFYTRANITNPNPNSIHTHTYHL